MSDGVRIFVGVLRIAIRVPGARSRKDRRQVIRSLRDRLRHRFEVTFHEVDDPSDGQRQVVVLTTAGNDGRPIRAMLDRCADLVRTHPVAHAEQVDVDVFRWHPSKDADWASRMMVELGVEEEADG